MSAIRGQGVGGRQLSAFMEPGLEEETSGMGAVTMGEVARCAARSTALPAEAGVPSRRRHLA